MATSSLLTTPHNTLVCIALTLCIDIKAPDQSFLVWRIQNHPLLLTAGAIPARTIGADVAQSNVACGAGKVGELPEGETG